MHGDPHPFIHRLKASGMSDAVIYQRLILEGWSRAVLDPIFEARGLHVAEASTIPTPAVASSNSVKRSRRKKVGKAISVIALLGLPFSGGAAYLYAHTPVVYSVSLPASAGVAWTTPIEYGALPQLADPDYYKRVVERFAGERASFIVADLSAMELSVYINGTSTLTVPILAKGRPGSWWETPTGVYKIESKAKSAYSTFGDVDMPFSMPFSGNFFIHGWPTHRDGTPVDTSFSGGCIRLATDDAERVYTLATQGMPVIVHYSSSSHDDFEYTPKGPSVSASSYLVADIRNGTVLMHKHADAIVPIASITKLITALVVIERFNLEKTITVAPEALVETTRPRLQAGQRPVAYDLLTIMLEESSNEAAEAFARYYGREQFIQLMNEKARSIGLTHTSFADPSGLSPDNRSSAEDVFTLLKYIYETRRFILDISRGDHSKSAYEKVSFANVANYNFIPQATNPFHGGKIGRTNEARETHASIFSIRTGGEERPIAIIALGSDNVQGDMRALLRSVNTLYATP